MQNAKAKIINLELAQMVEHARSLMHAATTLTGNKADAMRKRGMRMLDVALNGQQSKEKFIASNEMAFSEENFVEDNPWRAILVAIGAGLLAGVIMGLNN